MPAFLGHIGLDPIYVVGIKFERDAYREYKLFRRKIKLLDKEKKKAEAEHREPDPKMVADVKIMEKSLR